MRKLFLLFLLLSIVPSVVFGFPPPSDELPYGTCSNGQVAVYNTTTGRWDTCANNAASAGDVLADGTVPFTGAPIPNAANTVALGSAAAEWADIFLGDGGIVYGQNDQTNTMISSATGWRMPLPLSLGTASSVLGQLLFLNNVNANPFTIFPGATSGAGVGWRLPIAQPGGSNYLLNVDADGTMDYTNPTAFQAANADLAAIAALTCTENQIMKMNGADAWVCAADATGAGTTMANDTVWAAKGDLAVASANDTGTVFSIGTAYQVLHVATDTPGWTSTLGATGTRLTKGWFTDLEVTNAIAGSITGNAGTATALAADPADCASGHLATAIAASGALTCTTHEFDAPGLAGGLLQSDGTDWKRVTSLTGLSFDIGDAVASGHAATMDANGVLQTAFTALLPDAADGAALGAADREWSDIYLADGGVAWFGNDQDVRLEHVADTGLLLSDSSGGGTTQLQFGDSGTYINQSSDGVLNVASDTELKFLINDEDIKLTKTGSNGITIGTNTGTLLITSAIGFNVPIKTVEVDGHTDQTALTAAQVSGTTIYNTGQSAADNFLLLPTAAAGYSFVATVGTAQAEHFGVEAAAGDKIYLIAAAGTVAAGDDNAAVVMTAAQVGQSFACWTFKTDAYDWMCKAISIGTSTFAAHAHSTP